MKLTPELIHGFAGACLAKRYDGSTPTPQCHLEWWDLCCSDNPLVAIAAPRAHGKSTAITHAYLLAALLFRDRKFALIVSDTESQATNFLSDLKDEMINNEDLINLFGIKGLIKDSQTDIIVEFTDGEQFRVLVRGAEQRVRGLKWDQRRPDLIICDDLEGDEQVQSKDRREKFRRWFYAALLPCRSQHGIVRVVGTVLHLDSLLNRIMPPDYDGDYTKVEPLKTYSARKRVEWRSVRYRAHSEDYQHILWADRYTAEFFQIKKEDYTLDTNNTFLENYIETNKEYFPNFGGDIETYFFQIKMMHAKRVFGKSVKLRNIFTKDDLVNALTEIKKNQKKPTVKLDMYT
jgi:hypothetical protein